MEWTIEYLTDEDLLYIRTCGVMTRESADTMVKEIVEAAECHRCDRQIVDHRETLFAFSIIEYYERPDVNEKIGISRKWKIAMVFQELNENTQFMENVFHNRGYNFRQFNDLAEAKRWVLEN
ncbi:MAG TPA: hypothetical protein PK078_03470 [Anaerolineales bacterium]|nr:hypothetical protein [Anaerolineales bacterium]HNA88473.1 hypothetical protein [Anaerolineales bacterium]HNB36212.1 hypothetical protein [Anaerolineales bacterium]